MDNFNSGCKTSENEAIWGSGKCPQAKQILDCTSTGNSIVLGMSRLNRSRSAVDIRKSAADYHVLNLRASTEHVS